MNKILVEHIPITKRIILKNIIIVKDIYNKSYRTREVVQLIFYLSNEYNKYLIKIIREFHIISNLNYDIIFDNNIINSENIIIDIIRKKTIITSYKNIIYTLKVTSKKKINEHVIRCGEKTIIPAKFIYILPIKTSTL